MPSVSREEGYARGAGKEERGLKMAEHFFASKIGVEPIERVEGVANFFLGDHIFPSGRTWETKRQPIDPFKYRQNVIEVFEITGKKKHADGWRLLAGTLGCDEDKLKRCTYLDRNTQIPLPDGHISPSLLTARRATGYCYVNPDGPYLYICRSSSIRKQARSAFLGGNLRRGPGNCNDDSWVFFSPLPATRWKFEGGVWVWIGDGDEEPHLSNIREVLRA
jgi:hypothetical protein